MGMRAIATWTVAALLAVGLSQCAAPPTAVPPPVPSPVRPGGSGQLYGKVSLEGDRPLPGPATVMVKGQRVTTDAAGNYTVDGLPGGKFGVVVELKTKEMRYLAVPFTVVDQKQGLRLDIRLKEAADIDRFCSECHPFAGKQTRADQIVRDAHPSGIMPRKALRTRQLYDAQGLMTCESCHSLHQATGVERFVLYPFKNGDLCNRCH